MKRTSIGKGLTNRELIIMQDIIDGRIPFPTAKELKEIIERDCCYPWASKLAKTREEVLITYFTDHTGRGIVHLTSKDPLAVKVRNKANNIVNQTIRLLREDTETLIGFWRPGLPKAERKFCKADVNCHTYKIWRIDAIRRGLKRCTRDLVKKGSLLDLDKEEIEENVKVYEKSREKN